MGGRGARRTCSKRTVHALGSMGDRLVALGTRNAESGQLEGGWITADGRSWERYDDETDRAAAFDMAWDGDELLAWGRVNAGWRGKRRSMPGEAAIAWVSTDGRPGSRRSPTRAAAACRMSPPRRAAGWRPSRSGHPAFPDAPPALAGRVAEAEWLAVEIDAGAS